MGLVERRPATAHVFGLALLLVVVSVLAGCLPPRVGVRATPNPESAAPAAATLEPTEGADPSYDAYPDRSYGPVIEESFPAYSVSKPEIRDRAFDWDLRMSPAYDAYDAAATTTALGAAARDVLSGCKEQQDWLDGHTDYDPGYDEPMTMWRDAVDQLCAGASDVARGVDRGDTALIRKGKRAISAARHTMSSSEYLGAWGPLVIH